MDFIGWIKALLGKGKLLISDLLVGLLLTALMVFGQFIQTDLQTWYLIIVGLLSVVSYNLLIIMELYRQSQKHIHLVIKDNVEQPNRSTGAIVSDMIGYTEKEVSEKRKVGVDELVPAE